MLFIYFSDVVNCSWCIRRTPSPTIKTNHISAIHRQHDKTEINIFETIKMDRVSLSDACARIDVYSRTFLVPDMISIVDYLWFLVVFKFLSSQCTLNIVNASFSFTVIWRKIANYFNGSLQHTGHFTFLTSIRVMSSSHFRWCPDIIDSFGYHKLFLDIGKCIST